MVTLVTFTLWIETSEIIEAVDGETKISLQY